MRAPLGLMKNKIWLAFSLSGLLGVALFVPMPNNATAEMMNQTSYPTTYEWLVLAAGFLCALIYPKRIWVYPLGIFLGPTIVFSFIFPRHDPSGIVVWSLIFSMGISGLGALGGWLTRFLGTKFL